MSKYRFALITVIMAINVPLLGFNLWFGRPWAALNIFTIAFGGALLRWGKWWRR